MSSIPNSRQVAHSWLRKIAIKDLWLQFQQKVRGKKFRNPETDNDVLFQKLPRSEQSRIFSDWRQHGGFKERERGLISINKSDIQAHANRMADVARGWGHNNPDKELRSTSAWLPAGKISLKNVLGQKVTIPLRIGIGKSRSQLWRVGRKYTTGGVMRTGHYGKGDSTPLFIQVNLNPQRTFAEIAAADSQLEKEIYHILIHEITHARDIMPMRESKSPHYYNLPEEVRAFKRQVAEEVRDELDRRFGADNTKRELARRKRERGENVTWEEYDDAFDGPENIPIDAKSILEILERSATWDRVRSYLNPRNRREFLETVASVVRKYREDQGGKVACYSK